MKTNRERLEKMHSYSVADDCVQFMLGYGKYLMLFGNNDLMYFKNIIRSNSLPYSGTRNVYLKDERKNKFPYSQIPEHIERISLFRKFIFANQILDFEKPYIAISDGIITKVTVFKDDEDALVHTKILNGMRCIQKTKIVTSKELETYSKTGSLEGLDENNYKDVFIFDNRTGRLYEPCVIDEELEQSWIDEEKERLLGIIDKNDNYDEKTKKELQKVLIRLDEIESFIVTKKLMIKFKQNGEIKIDYFIIKFLQKGKYEIAVTGLPVTMESLSMIKSNIELTSIKTMKEPKINSLLNPHISKEQIEKGKVLIRKKSKLN